MTDVSDRQSLALRVSDSIPERQRQDMSSRPYTNSLPLADRLDSKRSRPDPPRDLASRVEGSGNGVSTFGFGSLSSRLKEDGRISSRQIAPLWQRLSIADDVPPVIPSSSVQSPGRDRFDKDVRGTKRPDLPILEDTQPPSKRFKPSSDPPLSSRDIIPPPLPVSVPGSQSGFVDSRASFPTESRLAYLKSQIKQARPGTGRARAMDYFETMEVPKENDWWGKLNYEKRKEQIDLKELLDGFLKGCKSELTQ
jgi:hypothetical protein